MKVYKQSMQEVHQNNVGMHKDMHRGAQSLFHAQVHAWASDKSQI